MPDGERIGRLTGYGTSGGGIPLPDAFRPVLEYLLDNGGSGKEPELRARITEALEYKERRVMGVWGSWEALTDDVITQLAAVKLIVADGDAMWALRRKLKSGYSYVVIPAAGGREAVRVTVRSLRERHLHGERAIIRMGLIEARNRARRLGVAGPAVEKHFTMLLRLLPGDEAMRSAGYAGRDGLSAYFACYVGEHADWVSIREVVDAWNAEHPKLPPLDGNTSSTMRRKARQMYAAGLLVRREHPARAGATEVQYKMVG